MSDSICSTSEPMPPPASRKRGIDELTEPERDLAFEIVANKWSQLYSEACKQRDEDDCGFEPDGSAMLEEASVIDPSSLPDNQKQRAIDTFGKNKMIIDSDNFYIDAATEYPVVGEPGVKGVRFVRTDTKTFTKYFVSEEKFTASSKEEDGEMVTIRIKTGKGGRAHFRVLKSVAKDMCGCD